MRAETISEIKYRIREEMREAVETLVDECVDRVIDETLTREFVQDFTEANSEFDEWVLGRVKQNAEEGKPLSETPQSSFFIGKRLKAFKGKPISKKKFRVVNFSTKKEGFG